MFLKFIADYCKFFYFYKKRIKKSEVKTVVFLCFYIDFLGKIWHIWKIISILFPFPSIKVLKSKVYEYPISICESILLEILFCCTTMPSSQLFLTREEIEIFHLKKISRDLVERLWFHYKEFKFASSNKRKINL